MAESLCLQYVQAICGSGKTYTMVKKVIESTEQYHIIATPTINLSKNIESEFERQGYNETLKRIDGEDNWYIDSVHKKIAITVNNNKETKGKVVLIITHQALHRYALFGDIKSLRDYNVIIDEVPEFCSSVKTLEIPDWDESHFLFNWLELKELESDKAYKEVTIKPAFVENAKRHFNDRSSSYKSQGGIYTEAFYDFLYHLINSKHCGFYRVENRKGSIFAIFTHNDVTLFLNLLRDAQSVTLLANNVEESLLVDSLTKLNEVKLKELNWGLPTEYKHGDRVTIQVMLKNPERKYTNYLSREWLDSDSTEKITVKDAMFKKIEDMLLLAEAHYDLKLHPLIFLNKSDINRFAGEETTTTAIHGLNQWGNKSLAIYLATNRLKPIEMHTLKNLEAKYNVENLYENAQKQRCYETCLQCLLRVSFRNSPRQEAHKVEEVTFFVPSYDYVAYIRRFIPGCKVKYDYAIEFIESNSRDNEEIGILKKILKEYYNQDFTKRKKAIKTIVDSFGIKLSTYYSWLKKHKENREIAALSNP